MQIEPDEDDMGREPFMRPTPGPQTPTAARIGRPPSMDSLPGEFALAARGMMPGGGAQPGSDGRSIVGGFNPAAVKEGISFSRPPGGQGIQNLPPVLALRGGGPTRRTAVESAVMRAPMPDGGPQPAPDGDPGASRAGWMDRLSQAVRGALPAPPEYRPRARRRRRLMGTGGTVPPAQPAY